MALSAFGLLSNDNTLTNAALAEIEKHPDFSTYPLQISCVFLFKAQAYQNLTSQEKRQIERFLLVTIYGTGTDNKQIKANWYATNLNGKHAGK